MSDSTTDRRPPLRLILTGLNGTVAPALASALRSRGDEVIPWDRARVPMDDERAVRSFIERQSPEWVAHIGTGPPEAAEWIARSCAALGVRLLWAGSVSVFGTRHTPPFTPDMEPDATDDYGRYKAECERRVRSACPDAVVARLGWQIGAAPGSNNMVDFLCRRAAEHAGRLALSPRWVPSCAFLDDSALAMNALITRAEAGVYHLEGNAAGLGMPRIARALARTLGFDWTVTETDEPGADSRMRDERVAMGQIAQRF